MQQADFRFGCPLRVRWSEADPQGIVFNGHYLNYADVGVTEYYRELNAANPGREDLSGNEFFAVKTLLEYRASAFFDDLLDIQLRVSRIGNSSMSFTLGIFRYWRNCLRACRSANQKTLAHSRRLQGSGSRL